MKTLRSFFGDARRHKGLALIIVLSMLALTTIVMLAFLSVADTEHKGTMTYSSSQSARRLADTAVNLVISQIRAGSDQDTTVNGREFHATQPGSVRKYTDGGAFLAGYKLFSDAEMIYTGSGNPSGNASVGDEYNFVRQSEPPTSWNQGENTVRYVDLNEPVIKGIAAVDGSVTTAQTFFPILDPRAAYDMDPSGGTPYPVEGFQYSTKTAVAGNNVGTENDSKQQSIVLPTSSGANLNSLRLAMPVQWLYMLKDGTLGTLDDSNSFQSSGGSEVSVTNPIVARIAFWADDETCKLNINTASEPTYQGKPTYFHERDHRWSDYPAARGEYQRFSGHPATVALSTVLSPNPTQDPARDLDTYGKTPGGAALTRAVNIKKKIYELIPRLNSGGSEAGTKLFAADDFNSGGSGGLTTNVVLTAALQERIYASVDELFFSEGSSAGLRQATDTVIQGGGGNIFSKQTLERASGFLTAHSRASEISMLGLPRIAMWPVHTDASRRTGFDNFIKFCARLGPVTSDNLYIFQRQDSRSPTTDIKLPRNKLLLDMLDKVLSTARFPSDTVSGGAGNTFKTKMRSANGFDNYRQVIVQMFDYIRSTNLHDSFLVEPQRGSWPTFVGNVNWEQTYQKRDSELARFKTYTVGIARNPASVDNPFADRAFPGHGQVSPAIWNVGGQNYRGFGRSVSISEIGLQFICTADGQPDMYSWRHINYDPVKKIYELTTEDLSQTGLGKFEADANAGIVSGGRTALRIAANLDSTFLVEDVDVPLGGGDHVVDNLAEEHWNAQGGPKKMKARYYSNFPPLSSLAKVEELYGAETGVVTDQNRGKHVQFHPGGKQENWNYTLEEDRPLGPREKQVQAMMHLEFFCPSVGYTSVFPEFSVVLKGEDLQGITVEGQSIFKKSGDIVLKSSQPLYEVDGSPQVGGYASFRRIARGRSLGPFDRMPSDLNYNTSTTGNEHADIISMDLVSSFFKVQSDTELDFATSGRPIRIDIYDTHDWRRSSPSQTIYFSLPKGRAPMPDLVVRPTNYEEWVDSNGTQFRHPALQAPHWWAFHMGGALARETNDVNVMIPGRLNEPRRVVQGNINTFYSGAIIRQNRDGDKATGSGGTAGQAVPGSTALIYGFQRTGNYQDVKRHDNSRSVDVVRHSRTEYDPANGYNTPRWHNGSDVVRTLQPGHGDARMIYAKAVVQETDWSPHPLYDSETAFMAHNFSNYGAGSEAGFDRSGDPTLEIQGIEDPTKRTLPQSVLVSAGQTPDAPYSGYNDNRVNSVTDSLSPAYLCQRYYDFDDSDPGGRVGTFINKADEGNFAVGDFQGTGWPRAVEWRATYFRSDSFGARFAPGAQSFFTPNRMISSPVMMGSLPSRVHYGNKKGPDASNGGNGAWTNLLFRPYVQLNGALTRHPGQATPPDHYLLDLFWMPVVEPYAISEPLSTAGKINMNYQMLPFTHIRRATALHAVMKGEVFAAMPNVDHTRSKGLRRGFGPQGSTAPVFRNETLALGDAAAKWHRTISVDRLNIENGTADNPWWVNHQQASRRVVGTLRQFEERFNFGATDVDKGAAAVGGNAVNEGLPSNFRSGLFRSASQICEVHLIPSRVSVTNNQRNQQAFAGTPFSTIVQGADNDATENIKPDELDSYSDRDTAMKKFWNAHASTGDNTRESPYANLYAKLTTRSNTFRVHVRAQTIKKALRGSQDNGWAIDNFTPGEDEVTGEYRGSFLLERYIDQQDLVNAGSAADFTQGNPMDESTHPPLDTYYRFRVIESKRFAP